jgi:SAM-dependent methyltransferase
VKEWYTRFYEAAASSEAYTEFCRRAYGVSLRQHGFADTEQLHLAAEALQLSPESRVLELGCGDGGIAEYLSDRTGARFHGIDYIPSAIRQAEERTREKADRLSFEVKDMGDLTLEPVAFNGALSVDALYFTDEVSTLERLVRGLAPGSPMAFFYTHDLFDGHEHEVETLEPGGTPVGRALATLGLAFATTDLSPQDCRYARRAASALEDLRPAFEREGNQFLYENRWAEAQGQQRLSRLGRTRRYLYLARA